jgi:hypothetical protein
VRRDAFANFDQLTLDVGCLTARLILVTKSNCIPNSFVNVVTDQFDQTIERSNGKTKFRPARYFPHYNGSYQGGEDPPGDGLC